MLKFSIKNESELISDFKKAEHHMNELRSIFFRMGLDIEVEEKEPAANDETTTDRKE